MVENDNSPPRWNRLTRGVNNVKLDSNKRKTGIMNINSKLLRKCTTPAYDLYGYLTELVNNKSFEDNNRFYVTFNARTKEEIAKELDISVVTLERAVRELKGRNVLIPSSKGEYIYNFVDFVYRGKDINFDVMQYKIEYLLK